MAGLEAVLVEPCAVTAGTPTLPENESIRNRKSTREPLLNCIPVVYLRAGVSLMASFGDFDDNAQSLTAALNSRCGKSEIR